MPQRGPLVFAADAFVRACLSIEIACTALHRALHTALHFVLELVRMLGIPCD